MSINKKHIPYIAVFTAVILFCCGCKKSSQDTGQQNIVRLDSIALACHKGTNYNIPDSLTDYSKALLQYIGAMYNDSSWVDYVNSRMVTMFAPEVAKVFPDLTELRKKLHSILHNINDMGVKLRERRYATVVWSDSKSIVINEPYVLIALNHYLGSEHPAYNGWQEYIRRTKTPEMLPYDITESLVCDAFPYDRLPAEKRTVLSRMIYEGVIAYVKSQVVPDADLKYVFGYDEKTLSDVSANESFAWRHIIEGKMLYSTDPMIMDKLFAPAPRTSIISPDAPGRIARFIGYRIIVKYIEKSSEININKMLSPDFFGSKNALEKAEYAPR